MSVLTASALPASSSEVRDSSLPVTRATESEPSSWCSGASPDTATLRLDSGRDPDDRATTTLVDELKGSSPEFARWWPEHRVHQRTFGTKHLQHPVVGPLTIAYESLSLPGDLDHSLFVYTTEAGTASRQALDLLASWAVPATRTSPATPAG
jgi:hypothetical protein